jgi:choline dehydrogenase-like flavoprotein
MRSGMSFVRAQKEQIDAWETVGNTGWNWSALWPYYLKSEDFQLPTAAQLSDAHVTYDSSDHGFGGPVKTGWAYGQANSTLPVYLNETFQALGLPWNPDTNGGYQNGFSVYPLTVDRGNNVREDAASAYYYPYQDRSNLQVLLNTKANRIVWTNASVPTAAGVEVTFSNGSTATISAGKEVILSAGALMSPLLLELSGVGNRAILDKYSIDVVVDLPGVGENLQDQTNNGLGTLVVDSLPNK